MVTRWLGSVYHLELQPSVAARRCLVLTNPPLSCPPAAVWRNNEVMSKRCLYGGSSMMTFQVNASLPTGKPPTSQGSSNCSQRGLDAARYPTYRSLRMGAGRRAPALFTQNDHIRRKFPAIQPLSKSREGKSSVSGFIIGGSPTLAEDHTMESENKDSGDLCGRHFFFDKKSVRSERNRTVIPPLPRDYHVHRPGNLHPFSLSKQLSHSHAGRPFTLGYPERYQLNTTPAVLFPSALVLNGRNTVPVQNCKLSRAKVNYPTYNLLTVKDNQKNQSYPDPVAGASRSFIHRISELSSLEAETVRQEKLKKMRKPRKPPS